MPCLSRVFKILHHFQYKKSFTLLFLHIISQSAKKTATVSTMVIFAWNERGNFLQCSRVTKSCKVAKTSVKKSAPKSHFQGCSFKKFWAIILLGSARWFTPAALKHAPQEFTGLAMPLNILQRYFTLPFIRHRN